ncbi:hypothetical protein SteCoe_18301 [Stentor coeruleus]|uniref:RING-type domain-containing protein n=1 Tax=Stentor coeruleus TaxID=5963 RepID=A0A1R2BWX9_9CILI|nr:hypothetical protein SteCoe_18301 [Stentor coeruleus]
MNLEELKNSIRNYPRLNILEALIAGFVIGATSLPADLILRFIAEGSASIPQSKKVDFYGFLLQKNLSKAKEVLATAKKPQNPCIINSLQSLKQDFPCKICKLTVPDSQIKYLENCADLFHSKCLKIYLEHQIERQVYPLNCPECKQEITENDISKQVTEEYFIKHQQKGIFIAMNEQLCVLECKNCGAKLENYKENTNRIMCPNCRISYCLKCLMGIHDTKNCDEFRKTVPLMKKCPRCCEGVNVKKSGILVCKCGAKFCSECLNYSTHCKCLTLKTNKLV